MDNHFISENETIISAFRQMCGFREDPLVLFVMDEAGHMVGTLTDGDTRRALVAGAGLDTHLSKVMHRNFNYLNNDSEHIVEGLKRQKALKMKLVPVLDTDKKVIEVINLERYITKLPVDVVLMAGGKGERLRPLTESIPKPLLTVGDKAIIDHNIDRLISYGVKHISVTVNYLKEQIEAHFSVPRGEVQVQTVREPKYLGTIGSIKYIERFHNDTVLVMNSDLFTDINYEDFFLHFKDHKADMSVAAVPYTVSVPYGIFDLDGRNIHGLIEKPTYNYYANAGIYLIKRSALDLIPEDTFFNATDLIELMIEKGKKVIRFPLNGTWIDIGNPQEYQKAKELVMHTH